MATDTTWGFNAAALAIPVAIELTAHILVHYTIPGAAVASSIAMFLSPVLDGVGLTTTFADSGSSLPSLDNMG